MPNQISAKRISGPAMFLRKNMSGWILVLPSLILFTFFIWGPLVDNFRLAFSVTQGTRTIGFAGFDNFRILFTHPNFLPALKNTFLYIFWSLVIGFWVPIIIAVLITEVLVGKNVFKFSIYLPNLLPSIAIILCFGRFFFSSGPAGVINAILGTFGIDPQPWLTTAFWTIPVIVITMTWRAAGNTALIYMATIGNIKGELYEAATIDGAGPLRRFLHITLPGILSLGKTLLILQIIAVFQVLFEPLVMTNGGPNNASISIMQFIFEQAFRQFKYPVAAAGSVIVCMILVVLTLIYFRVTRKVD